MNVSISAQRRKYGEGFLSIFPDGTSIPWKPLRLRDFLQYDSQFREGRISHALLEDEIFAKCVLDKNFVLNASQLEAGLVTTVVGQIMQVSGPGGPQQIAQDLNTARYSTSNFFSDAAAQIAQVFPSYKIHEVLDLDYGEFMEVLSLAERRLLAMGILQEPIQVVTGDQVVQTPGRGPEIQFKDLNPTPVPDPYMPVEPRPQQNKAPDDVIISGANDMLDAEIMMSLQGHDQMDMALWKRDATEGLEQIYPELFERMKKGEKITPEVIRETKGKTPQEVEKKYKKYTQDMLAGNIEHKPSQPLIAWDREEGAKAKPRVKRRKG